MSTSRLSSSEFDFVCYLQRKTRKRFGDVESGRRQVGCHILIELFARIAASCGEQLSKQNNNKKGTI
jgi:hypothetical protein